MRFSTQNSFWELLKNSMERKEIYRSSSRMKKIKKAKNFKGKFANLRINITVKKPIGSRKTFSLIRDEKSSKKVKDSNGEEQIINDRIQKIIEIPELNAINEGFISGEISSDAAYQLVLDLKKVQLEKLNGPDTYGSTIYHADNLKIINKLKEELNLKELRTTSYDNAIIDYNRIRDMLKGESIRIISRPKLNELIKKLPYRISVKNKIICRLNLVLKKAERDFKIPKKKIEEYEEISFIDEKQLKTLLNRVDFICGNSKLIKDGIILMFYCGFREGELFGISREHFNKKDKTYFIKQQMQRDFSITKPKNNKYREIPVPSEAIESLDRWLSYSQNEKQKYRQFLSRKVVEASRKTFTEKKHQVSNHDLRHSFAIWCLSKGLSLTEVAFLLGNTLTVCVRHYTGYSLQKEALKNIAKKLG